MYKSKIGNKGKQLTTLFRRRARGRDPRHAAEEVRGRDAVGPSRGAVGAERRVGRRPGARRRTFKGRRRCEWRHMSQKRLLACSARN